MVEGSVASAATMESKVIRPSSVMQKVEKQMGRERRETGKVGMMRGKVGQSGRDCQTGKVGTLKEEVGSKGQQE